MKSIIKKVPDYLNYSLLVGPVFAQKINIVPPTELNRIAGFKIAGVITALIQLILVIAAIVAFVFLLWGGIKWITSGGDKEQTAAAQRTITAAVIGLAIVLLSWAIMTLLGGFLGVDILSNLAIPNVQ